MYSAVGALFSRALKPHPLPHGCLPQQQQPALQCTTGSCRSDSLRRWGGSPWRRALLRARRAAAALPAHQQQQWQPPQQGQQQQAAEAAEAVWVHDPSQAPVALEEVASTEVLSELSASQLASAVWHCAKQGCPRKELLCALLAEVHFKLGQFRPQDLSNTLWALAVLRYQPSSSWWEAFENQVYMKLTEFQDRELGNLMWSLAVLDHRSTWILEPLLTAAADNFSGYSANALHLVGWSCGKLRFCPSSEWLQSYLRAVQTNFFSLSPNEMSNIIWALAKLGHELPDMWLDNFLMVAQWRFPSFNPKTLSVIAWAVAAIRHTPTQEWLLSYEQQVRDKFMQFTGQEVICVEWALRQWGYRGEDNAVQYMLQQQDSFQELDWETLSNRKLLNQVIQWKQEDGNN